jgi:hypothetical protein
MPNNLTSLCALSLFLVVACGDDGPPPGDSGMGDAVVVDSNMPDARPDTSGPVDDICTAPIAAVGEVGMISVSGNTNTTTLRPIPLGAECGNTEAARYAPQEVVAYQVPGTEEVGVFFTLANSGTSTSFASIVEVRADCLTPPTTDRCFQNITTDEPRASGALTAMGGDTLYLIVSGFAEAPSPLTDRGAWQLDITAGPNDPPVLVGGQLNRVGDALEVALEGTDDRGGVGYRLELQTADGMGVDLNEDGSVNEADWVAGTFENDVSMMMSFVGTDRFIGIGEDLLDAESIVQAEVAVRDIFGIESAPMVITITDGAGVGDACGATTPCASELTCTSDLCASSSAAMTACASPTAITIDTPTTTTTTAMVSGSLPAGMGALSPGCTSATGPEVAYAITVPGGGTFDVVARTDLAGSGETDTMVYLRTTCDDPTTELVCNDDIDLEGGNYRSRIELLDAPAGAHVIIVEQWAPEPPTMAGPFAMEVALRPVLATGATCDNAGVMNRCAAGACAAGTCP